MALYFACACGQELMAAPQHVGQLIECPKCGQSTVAPAFSPAALPQFDSYSNQRQPPAAQTSEGTETDPENPLAFVDPGQSARNRDRAVREREETPFADRTPVGHLANSGMIGGSLMLLLSAVLFVVGLSLKRFFILTLVLLILGFVAFIKGVFTPPRRYP